MYALSEIAFYLRMPPSTVRSWVFGQQNFQRLITAQDPRSSLLSFTNLIELYVLCSLRRGFGIKMHRIREAVVRIARRLDTEHPLAEARIATDKVEIYFEQLGRFLPVSGDTRQKRFDFVQRLLHRIEWEGRAPSRIFPYVRIPHLDDPADEPRRIVIDPLIQAGRPVIAGTRVPTQIIAERFFADEDLESIALDYDLDLPAVQAALRWERRANVGRAA